MKAFPYVIAIFVLLISGCSSGDLPPYEITYDDPPVLKEALEEGFAMAPVAAAVPITGGTESVAYLTNELYTSLLVFTEGIEIVEPGVLLKRIANGGDEFREFSRKFHRSRINGEELSQSDTARLYPHVATRFLFLSWVAEKGDTDIKETGADYQDINNALDIYNVTFKTYEGVLTGELIDLATGQLVWRGVARYETGELYADNRPEDLWARRSSACTALARLLSLD